MARDIFADVPPREVTPRRIAANPRCPACKSADPHPGIPPMFHPAHPFGPCEVYSDRYGECGCTYEAAEGEGLADP